MSYQVISVYSLSQEDMDTCIRPCNADPANIAAPSVQVACFSAVTDDVGETLVSYCVSVETVPNNSTFAPWAASLAAVKPFSERTPIDVRIPTRLGNAQ